ncbi:class I SAM-dependent methyltransferase [Nocardia sp. NBC_01503]|uniref:class I SAM-dependent methyltransferase n=1 Tax=Nocardia sp. NBC_01503 TaxID=2975997 RepID=UPI002E7C3B37|nr:class I SAM-dependent methyltransferase [Nocardia sp. NBC_01503]WTL31123.1 class I SAM-dependent methyltransferase [Nocardia sp. NBC_01503]
MMITDRPTATRRRLLTAARCRYAEDRLADAITAGISQLVLLGPALDTFARHNPYPGLHVTELTDAQFVSAASGFDLRAPAFLIRLTGTPVPRGPGDRVPLTTTLRRLGSGAAGSEIVFDYLPERHRFLPEFLSDRGFEVLEDLGAAALASRYLDRPVEGYSGEPRVIRARVRHNFGHPPSQLDSDRGDPCARTPAVTRSPPWPPSRPR